MKRAPGFAGRPLLEKISVSTQNPLLLFLNSTNEVKHAKNNPFQVSKQLKPIITLTKD